VLGSSVGGAWGTVAITQNIALIRVYIIHHSSGELKHLQLKVPIEIEYLVAI
jgi:hypothetical protein